ncbi:hypothetical protein DIPPA_21386 [Diplonema papillatum]|nr:hypothetical protein DIPPA_21386 [Diplonema papillatum]
MVLLHMKSTTEKDEWLFSAPAATETDPLLEELVEIHNLRVRLKSQMLALWNVRHENDGQHMQGNTEEQRGDVERLFEDIKRLMHADRAAERVAVDKASLQDCAEKAEAAARACFPAACGAADAVDTLWKQREDPDTNEDDRLRAWYYLELIDPMFRERDFLTAANAKLWWAGKEVARGRVLSDYTGKNDKSKAVCKLAAGDKGCPAREPAMRCEDQRAVRQYFTAKREEFKTLEPSELAHHKNVRPKPSDFVAYSAPTSTGKQFFGDASRSPVDATAAAGGSGMVKLNTNVRPICPGKRTETELAP